jgi:hypothetical protein
VTRIPFTLLVLLAGIGVAVVLFVVTGGHLLFLPLLFILPFGLFWRRSSDR